MKKSILIILLLNSYFSFSQNMFQQRIGTNNDETAKKIFAFSDGTYIICASYNSPSSVSGFYLIKMDISGNILWAKIYFDSLNLQFSSMVKTYDNCLAVLSQRIVGPYYYELMLTKIDSSGSIIWNYSYSNTGRLTLINNESLNETSDHGFIITVGNFSSPWNFAVLIKSDSAGNLLWNKAYRYGNIDLQGAVAYELNDGTFLFSISGYPLPSYQYFWLMAKLDTAGNVMSLNNIQDWDILNNSQFHPIGNEYYLLFSQNYITCVNSNAKLFWIKKFDSLGTIINKSIKLPNKGFALTGHNYNANGDALFMTADSAGNILSSHAIEGTQTDMSYSLCQLSNRSFLLTGRTNGFSANSFDIYLTQSDTFGNFGCNQTTLGITNSAYTVPFYQDTMFVSSIPILQSPINLGDSAITLTQNFICSTTAVKEPVFSKSLILFPNPTDGLFTLRLGEQFPIVNITINNAFGQEVNRTSFKNTSQIELNIQGETGMYFVRFTTGEGMSAVYKVVKM